MSFVLVGAGLDILPELPGHNVHALTHSLPLHLVLGDEQEALLAAEKQFFADLERARAAGPNLIYNFGHSCLGNLEFIRKYHERLVAHIGRMEAGGVDQISLSIPYLIEIVKAQFPRLEVVAALAADLDCVQRGQFLEWLGADQIVVQADQNRNKKFLQSFRRGVNAPLHLLLNEGCIFFCPFAREHKNREAHHSINNSCESLYCLEHAKKLFTKEELIKMRWIRPEDLASYQQLGYQHFHLLVGGWPQERIMAALKAYNQGSFAGNIVDLIHFDPGIAESVSDISLENAALDGFIAGFEDINCRVSDCRECRYCHNMVAKIENPELVTAQGGSK